jgi:peroxiredoxin
MTWVGLPSWRGRLVLMTWWRQAEALTALAAAWAPRPLPSKRDALCLVTSGDRASVEDIFMRGWIISMAAAALLVGCGDDGTSSGAAASSGSGTSSATGSGGNEGNGGGGAGQGGAGQGGAATGGGGAGLGGSGGGSAAIWGPEHCPAPSPDVNVGYNVGDRLPDIVVKDCDGNDVSLTAFCGADALFIFAAHGWCPLCKGFSAQAEAVHDSFAGKNLASVNIVVEKGSGDPPDAAYCKLWRDQHGLEDVATFYDPTGAVLALWSGSSSLSAYVDQNRLITGKLVHDSNVDNIKAEIQKALDK